MKRLATTFSFPAFLAALTWGTVLPVTKIGVLEMGPLAFASIRLFAAAGLLFLLLLLSGGRVRVTRRELGWLLLAGVVGLGLSSAFFHLSLGYTAASHTAILAATAPIFTVLLALALGLERPAPRHAGAILLAFAGVALVMQWGREGGQGSLFGDLMAVALAASWGAYNVMVLRLAGWCSPVQILAYVSLFAAAVLAPLALPEIESLQLSAISPAGWFSLAYAVGLGSTGAFILWQRSIQRIGAGKTMVYYYLQPISGVVTAAFLFQEQLVPLQIAGALLVLISVGLAATRRAP
ncbi:MAG TPA: DMT family transporter [Dehalococcoidia bacterium]|nr:DMT family transporter [Dehalococcoidia bacterium]